MTQKEAEKMFTRLSRCAYRIHKLNDEAQHDSEHRFAKTSHHSVAFNSAIATFADIGTYEHAILDGCSLIAGYLFTDSKFMDLLERKKIDFNDITGMITIELIRMLMHYRETFGAES